MVTVGKFNQLQVLKQVDFGVYLDGDELDNILPFIVYKEISDNYLLNEVVEFKGIKETHPLFEEIEEYLPHLKAYKKIKAISSVKEVTTAIATLFMKYIETDKRAGLNLSCGWCKSRYYERMIYGYNKLAEEYGRECI